MFAVLPSNVIGRGLDYGTSYPPQGQKVSSPAWGSHQQHDPTTDIRRRVTIYRDSIDTPWGFRLQGGKDFNTPLSVKRVFSGSPAVGQLTRDDLILAIDDESVDGLFHADVLDKIKSAGNSISLTIQTSALEPDFGYASQVPFQPLQGASHQKQLYNPEEVRLQYEAYQAPPAPSYDAPPTTNETSPTTYETSPTTYETSPTTYETAPTTYETSPTTETTDPTHNRTAANVYNPRNTTHQSRHRSARKFHFAATAPSGLSEPGWVPRPKSVPRNLPSSTPQQPLPASQYKSPPAVADHQSVGLQYPSTRDFWKPESTSAESGVPAWYGSLRSTRAPHTWEVRAAKVQIASEQESSDVLNEPQQSQRAQLHEAEKQQIQSQQEPSRTFKAEIRGLRLARPAYPHTQSTPEEWEDASAGRIYRSQDYTHSAPETPVVDANVHEEVKHLTSYQDIQTAPSDNYTQQTVESPPVKLQPSLLFGERSGRGVQQPSSQSRVVIRAQPQATRATATGVHDRQEVPAPTPKGVTQLVSPHTIVPVHQARQAHPQVHPIVHQKAQEAVVQKPSQVQPSIIQESPQPAKITHLPVTVERFNPGPEPRTSAAGKYLKPIPERLTNLPHLPVERFNPMPDRQQQLTQTQVKHVSVPQAPGKLSKTPVERFNPMPDRSGLVKHVSVAQAPGKLSKTPVERFNPMPDRPGQLTKTQVKHVSVPQAPGKLSKTPVERFNPMPDRPGQLTKTQVKHVSVPQAPGKLSKTPVERFNPMPDRSGQVKHVSVPQAPGKLSETPVERFNPMPDGPNKSSQTKSKHLNTESATYRKTHVERFNPGPDRLYKA